jgi:hypothetical protein
VTQYAYDYSNGKTVTTTDPNGNIFVSTYDGLGRPALIKQPDPSATSTLLTKTVYAYTDDPNAATVYRTDYLNSASTVETYSFYDGLKRVRQTRKSAEDDNYETRDFAYNDIGLLQKESLPYFSTGSASTTPATTPALYTSYTYDALQRVTDIANVLGTTTKAYVTWKTTVTDPNGKKKDLKYDAYGNLAEVDEYYTSTSSGGGMMALVDQEYAAALTMPLLSEQDGDVGLTPISEPTPVLAPEPTATPEITSDDFTPSSTPEPTPILTPEPSAIPEAASAPADSPAISASSSPVLVAPSSSSDLPIVGNPAPVPSKIFDWRHHPELEDRSKRTHDTKDFQDPDNPNRRIVIQSSGLLHAYTNLGYQDIETELPSYEFPDGITASEDAGEYPVLDLPSWGTAKVEDNGATVRVYDKLGVSIFVYRNLIAVPVDVAPYEVYSNGNKIQCVFSDSVQLTLGQELRKSPSAQDLTWAVKDGKLYAEFAAPQQGNVQLYDATDTSSTDNGDGIIKQADPNSNLSTDTDLYVVGDTGDQPMRTLLKFTLASGAGSISDIKLYLYKTSNAGTTAYNNELHQITQTGYDPATVTWNKYDGTNNWTNAGGGAEFANFVYQERQDTHLGDGRR